MNKKNLTIAIVGVVIIAGASFFGGIKYSSGKMSGRNGANRFGGVEGENGQQNGNGVMRFGQAGQGSFGGRMTTGVMGEVISKDDKSITVKLRDGGSRIVFLSEKTAVQKNVSGQTSDLTTGLQVLVMGTPNTDGSFNASTVDIRPFSPDNKQNTPVQR